MSVRFVTCPSKGPRVDPRAVGCGELGPRCVCNALLAGEATAAFWTPGQAGPAVPSAALRVVRLAGHRSLEIHSSVPHSSMNASLSIVPFLWELHSKRAMVNAREVAEKNRGHPWRCVWKSVQFRRAVYRDCMFFDIHPLVHTPRVGPIIICLPSLSFVVVASLLKKATSLPAADRSFPVDWRKLL